MRRPIRHHGSIIIIAMIVLFALAALVLTLNRGARTDMALAANMSATHQADEIERGAEQYVLGLLTDYRDTLADFTDSDFEQVPVGDGYFWITRTDYGDTSVSRFGLMDESSKLNLNVAPFAVLRTLPGMTDELAGAIVDWRDTDDEVSEQGAESNSYTGLSVSYRAKNADFEAVEEMLLLKGMTRELMYGDPASVQTGFNSDYYQANGLADFFTVWSTQSTTASDGTTKISVNDLTQRPQLRTLLETQLGTTRGTEVANSIGPGSIQDIFMFAQRTSLTTDEFIVIENLITFQAVGQGGGGGAATPQRGLINVNTAPREVLLAIAAQMDNPISESDVDALIARRSGTTITSGTAPSLAWVYDVLQEKAVGLGRYICAQGSQFSADIVSASRTGRAYRCVRIVVDTAVTPARIVYRRDLTDRGWPLDSGILTQLSSGQSVQNNGAARVSGGFR